MGGQDELTEEERQKLEMVKHQYYLRMAEELAEQATEEKE